MTANRIIAGCMLFLVLIVSWEIAAGFIWQWRFEAAVELQMSVDRTMAGLSRGPLPSWEHVEAKVRAEGNPYSLFR